MADKERMKQLIWDCQKDNAATALYFRMRFDLL
jgi:hypothetical protein